VPPLPPYLRQRRLVDALDLGRAEVVSVLVRPLAGTAAAVRGFLVRLRADRAEFLPGTAQVDLVALDAGLGDSEGGHAIPFSRISCANWRIQVLRKPQGGAWGHRLA
jgi:hypothetical protein